MDSSSGDASNFKCPACHEASLGCRSNCTHICKNPERSWEEVKLLREVKGMLQTRLNELERELETTRNNCREKTLRLCELRIQFELETKKSKFLGKLVGPKHTNHRSLKFDAKFVVHNGSGASRTIFSHRFILGCKSRIFCAMFSGDTVEARTGQIDIRDASVAIMEAVVSYCYYGAIGFSDTILPQEVLRVAHKYQIGDLQYICEAELAKMISNSNLNAIIDLCRTYKAGPLKAELIKFCVKKLDETQLETVFDHLLNPAAHAVQIT